MHFFKAFEGFKKESSSIESKWVSPINLLPFAKQRLIKASL